MPRYASASKMLVLPVPFGPAMTVVPSASGLTEAAWNMRKSANSTCRTATALVAPQETRTGMRR